MTVRHRPSVGSQPPLRLNLESLIALPVGNTLSVCPLNVIGGAVTVATRTEAVGVVVLVIPVVAPRAGLALQIRAWSLVVGIKISRPTPWAIRIGEPIVTELLGRRFTFVVDRVAILRAVRSLRATVIAASLRLQRGRANAAPSNTENAATALVQHIGHLPFRSRFRFLKGEASTNNPGE